MSKGVVIGIVVAVLAVGAGGYYFYTKNQNGSQTKGSSESTGGSSKKVSDACKYNDRDLCKFVNTWSGVDKYTLKSSTTGEGGQVDSTFMFDGKDKSQMMMVQNGTESFNVITMGNTTYMKDYADNKWTKTTYSPENSVTDDYNFDFDSKAEQADDKTTYNKIGTESCGKFNCFKYQIIEPEQPDVTQFLWFDNREYKLRRLQFSSDDGTTDMTVEYANVSIKEPSPIKEQSSVGGSGASGAPSAAELERAQQQLNNATQSQESSAPADDSGSSDYQGDF